MTTTNPMGTRDAPVVRRRLGRGCHLPAAGVLAIAVLCLLLAAACSSAAAGNAVTDPLVLRGDQDLVNFARCMRAHGVQMSDPYHQPGHIGLTVDTPAHTSATATGYAACNHYMQALIQIKESRTADLASSRLADLTLYAECMRAHDINMLDPTPRGELDLGDVPGMANNDFGRQSPQFRSADATCRNLLPAGVTDDGTGP